MYHIQHSVLLRTASDGQKHGYCDISIQMSTSTQRESTHTQLVLHMHIHVDSTIAVNTIRMLNDEQMLRRW